MCWICFDLTAGAAVDFPTPDLDAQPLRRLEERQRAGTGGAQPRDALAPFAEHCPNLRTFAITHVSTAFTHLAVPRLRLADDGIRAALGLSGPEIPLQICRQPRDDLPATHLVAKERRWRIQYYRAKGVWSAAPYGGRCTWHFRFQ